MNDEDSGKTVTNFVALVAPIGEKCCVIVGTVIMVSQALQIVNKPKILILKALKFLVMDETGTSKFKLIRF